MFRPTITCFALVSLSLAPLTIHSTAIAQPDLSTWVADNGDGSYTNPLFYDEFSDPDLIRVGEDFYLTGTTMHSMPGLPVLHSRDLVNWELKSYALTELNLGPEYRLEDGESIYGQGIWAPSFRYHDGTFHIFANVNGQTTQHFTATDPGGPWEHQAMKCWLHDLSVLFEEDGRAYVIWGYREIRFAQLNTALDDIVPGTERVLIPAEAGFGEGAHFYKFKGRYYITCSNYEPVGYMACARSEDIEGPYQITTISAAETFGVGNGWRLQGMGWGEFGMMPVSGCAASRNSCRLVCATSAMKARSAGSSAQRAKSSVKCGGVIGGIGERGSRLSVRGETELFFLGMKHADDVTTIRLIVLVDYHLEQILRLALVVENSVTITPPVGSKEERHDHPVLVVGRRARPTDSGPVATRHVAVVITVPRKVAAQRTFRVKHMVLSPFP